MEKALNDNSDPWTTISAATERVVKRLDRDKKQHDDCADDGADKKPDEKGDAERRAYVDHRLMEIRAWERRISGKG